MFGIRISDGTRDLTLLQRGDAGNVTLKKRDPGSPVWRMFNENLVVPVLEEKRNSLRVLCLYR